MYRDSDIVLLDDPLSAVDAVVSRHLFDEYVLFCCKFPSTADKEHKLQGWAKIIQVLVISISYRYY